MQVQIEQNGLGCPAAADSAATVAVQLMLWHYFSILSAAPAFAALAPPPADLAALSDAAA
jgi:hypothetical protein